VSDSFGRSAREECRNSLADILFRFPRQTFVHRSSRRRIPGPQHADGLAILTQARVEPDVLLVDETELEKRPHAGRKGEFPMVGICEAVDVNVLDMRRLDSHPDDPPFRQDTSSTTTHASSTRSHPRANRKSRERARTWPAPEAEGAPRHTVVLLHPRLRQVEAEKPVAHRRNRHTEKPSI
jgi:hypothetical protein